MLLYHKWGGSTSSNISTYFSDRIGTSLKMRIDGLLTQWVRLKDHGFSKFMFDWLKHEVVKCRSEVAGKHAIVMKLCSQWDKVSRRCEPIHSPFVYPRLIHYFFSNLLFFACEEQSEFWVMGLVVEKFKSIENLACRRSGEKKKTNMLNHKPSNLIAAESLGSSMKER